MFSLKKILLPVDFSERCVGAARYVEALVDRCQSEAVLLHVIPPPHYEFTAMEVGGSVLTELYSSRAALLQQECEQFLARELPGLHARRITLEGDPARKIVEYAHNQKFDLIVLPTHGYGPFRRFVLGSVTAKVLHDADCPVWTGVHMEQAPPAKSIELKTVLAGVDLGPQSRKTVSWARHFAAALGARLVVVHATPSIEGHSGEYFDPDWRHHLKSQAGEKISALLAEAGATADVLVEAGDAAKVVCDTAGRENAGVLVIGRGSAAGIFGRLRANAYSIIRQSPCPVISV